MSVEVGSAVGYLDLDIKGFLDGLKSAQEAAGEAAGKITKSFGDKMKDTGKSLQKIGKNISLYISGPVAAAGTALTKLGSDFETEMKNIEAITGMSGDEMQELEKGIRDIAMSSGTSQTALANAAKMVAEAGGDMSMMLSQLEAGNNLAIASQTDLATTLDMVGSTMKTFGLEAEDTRGVVDSLASVTTLANTTLSDINQAFVNAGGSAAQAGLSVDDVNAVLVKFADAGLKGGAAGTALNRMLMDLMNPTSTAKDALDGLGVSVYDSGGAMRSMFDIMQDLESALSDLTDEERAAAEGAVFNTVSLKGWNIITEAGVKNIRELSDELSDSVNAFDGIGQAAGMAGVQNESFGAKIRSIIPHLEELGKTVLETLKPMFEWLIETIKSAISWFNGLPTPLKQVVVWLGAIAAAVGPLVYAIGTVMVGFGNIIAIAPKISMAFRVMWAAATGPIGSTIILAGLLATAIIYNWDEIVDSTKALGKAMLDFFEFMAENAVEFTENLKMIGSDVGEFFGEVGKGILEIMQETGRYVLSIGRSALAVAGQMINWAIDIGKEIVNGVWKGIMYAGSWFVKQVTDFFVGIVNTVKWALGIESPSKVFADQVGKWIPLGIAEGFEDAMPLAIRNMQKVLDTGIGKLAADDVQFDYSFAPVGRDGRRQTADGSGGWGQQGGGSGGGGNTYNFYSPEPIDAAAARREMEQLNRNMAFGF